MPGGGSNTKIREARNKFTGTSMKKPLNFNQETMQTMAEIQYDMTQDKVEQ